MKIIKLCVVKDSVFFRLTDFTGFATREFLKIDNNIVGLNTTLLKLTQRYPSRKVRDYKLVGFSNYIYAIKSNRPELMIAVAEFKDDIEIAYTLPIEINEESENYQLLIDFINKDAR